MKTIYAEIGFGNETFFSTEIEEDEKEYRVAKLIFPKKIKDLYLRFWIFKKVFIFSIKDGFVIMNKDKNKLKILFGIRGDAK